MLKSFRTMTCVFVALLALSIIGNGQVKNSESSDQLRAQVKTLEGIDLQSKSASVKIIHARTLVRVYNRLMICLDQDITDLMKIDSAIGDADTTSSLEIGVQLEALNQEQETIANRVQELNRGLIAISTSSKDPVRNSQNVSPAATSSLSSKTQPLMVSTPQVPAAPTVVQSKDPNPSIAVVNPVSPGQPLSTSANNGSSTQPAQPADTKKDATRGFDADLNERIDAVVKAKINKRSNSNQTEAPSIGGNSTSLVDQTSAGDLVNMALNFAGLTATSNSNNMNEGNSFAVTTSAYALLAAAQRVDPLNPGFYNRNSIWRRFSFTLGYEDPNNTNGFTETAKLFGAKFLIINKRDASNSRHDSQIKQVSASLREATRRYGRIWDKIQAYIFSNKTARETIIKPQFRTLLTDRLKKAEDEKRAADEASTTARTDEEKKRVEQLQQNLNADIKHLTDLQKNVDDDTVFAIGPDGLIPIQQFVYTPGAPLPPRDPKAWSNEEVDYLTQFENNYLGKDYKTKLSKDILDQIDRFVEKELEDTKAFENLDDSTRDAISEIRRAPQFSVYFLSKQRRQETDEYFGEAIFDYGVANKINLTLNGAYKYLDNKTVGGDKREAKFTGQLQFQMTKEDLVGKKPIYLYVGGESNWQTGRPFLYKAQAKLTLPISEGLDLPLSITFASRTDLINEKTVKGQVGFTFDTARLIQSLLPR